MVVKMLTKLMRKMLLNFPASRCNIIARSHVTEILSIKNKTSVTTDVIVSLKGCRFSARAKTLSMLVAFVFFFRNMRICQGRNFPNHAKTQTSKLIFV